jgi:predicted transcriptional regulator
MAHKTVKGVGAFRLIDKKVSTYHSMIANYNLMAFDIDITPDIVTQALINNINKFLNIKVLEKRGLVTKNTILTEGITNDIVASYILNNIDDTLLQLYSYFEIDYAGKPVKKRDYNIMLFLSEQNGYDSNDIVLQLDETYTVLEDGTTSSARIEYGSLTIDGVKYKPTVENNSIKIGTNNNNEPIIYLEDINDENNTYELVWDNRDNIVYACYYEYEDDNSNDNNHYVTTIYILKKDIGIVYEQNEIMIVPMKLKGEAVADDYKFTLTKFGVKKQLREEPEEDNEDNEEEEEANLYDVYSNEKIKNMFLAYMSKLEPNPTNEEGQEIPLYDSKYLKPFVKLMYGDYTARKYVEIPFKVNDNEILLITYGYGTYETEDGKKTEYGMNMMLVDNDGNELDQYGFTPMSAFYDNAMPFFIVAVDTFSRLPLKERYDLYDALLSIATSTTDRIKLKWYQTWWGQILIGAVLMWIGGMNFYYALLLSSVNYAIIQLTPVKYRAYISFVLNIIEGKMMGNTSLSNIVTNPNTYFQVAQFVLKNLATKNLKEKQAELKALIKKTEKLEDELPKYGKPSFQPYDDTHNIMESLYNPDEVVWNTTNIELATISEADKFYDEY